MRDAVILLLSGILFFAPVAEATEVEGEVWGVWTRENSPYNVIGEIRVPPGSTLVIDPGVVVNFQGHYKFIVDDSAVLEALGTESDSIVFTAQDPAEGWHGIRFTRAHSSSQVGYCRLKFGRADVTCYDNCGGAIYCCYSSPTISSNTISDNSASFGGGIYCDANSAPFIEGNTISANYAYYLGAGIYCDRSSVTIENNRIVDNRTRVSGYGGGIHCNRASTAIVTGNLISGNQASLGGGIYCDDGSRPTITGNIISANVASGLGGAIYCETANPEISSNIFSLNSATWGGAIYCEYSSPRIVSNTISGNSAESSGGGIYCFHRSDATITNTILWGNSAPQSPEIYIYNSNPQVTYCDVQGGWSGQGNIDADPTFVGPEREDLHLRWRSPCIDAGDPASLDPDGTRSDIGALYFDQAVPGIVELYPRNAPIVIPPEGGEATYDGWTFNFSGQTRRIDIWTYLFVPERGPYGPVELYENIRIPVDSLGRNRMSQEVPGHAPAGDYVYVAYVGDYPAAIVDSSYFYFSKSGSIEGDLSHWLGRQDWLRGTSNEECGLPIDWALSQNYPNPFNAVTTIGYQLPTEADVRLEIFDLLGRVVATLVGSRQKAGCHSVVWEASDMSSGRYFYKLTAGEETLKRKMTLVK